MAKDRVATRRRARPGTSLSSSCARPVNAGLRAGTLQMPGSAPGKCGSWAIARLLIFDNADDPALSGRRLATTRPVSVHREVGRTNSKTFNDKINRANTAGSRH